MISFACPDCQKTYSVPDTSAGRGVRCKGCGQVFRVPGAETSEVVPAEDAPVVVEAENDHSGLAAEHDRKNPSILGSLGRAIADCERVILRIGLYYLFLAGTFGIPHRRPSPGITEEMFGIYGDLVATASICTLAIVAWCGKRR